MVAPLSKPDLTLFDLSHSQLVTCTEQPSIRKVVNVKTIVSVVAAHPHEIRRHGDRSGALVRYGDPEPTNCYFDQRLAIVEKPGMRIAQFAHGDESDVD